MKVKNVEIIGTLNFLNTLLEKKLPSKLSYVIMENYMSFEKSNDVLMKTLQNTIDKYKDKFIKDDNGNVIPDNALFGVPKVDESVSNEYKEFIIDILSMEVDVESFDVDKEVFNYDSDNKYDVLTVKELITLKRIMSK